MDIGVMMHKFAHAYSWGEDSHGVHDPGAHHVFFVNNPYHHGHHDANTAFFEKTIQPDELSRRIRKINKEETRASNDAELLDQQQQARNQGARAEVAVRSAEQETADAAAVARRAQSSQKLAEYVTIGGAVLAVFAGVFELAGGGLDYFRTRRKLNRALEEKEKEENQHMRELRDGFGTPNSG
eukprot:GEMP01077995.1.p1 GENE.GEMP01077995.1~~GEMP01077995.1.p1  ORF type:complete len:183 (+),score=55.47 GEMP01077995.1:233-781(+)